MPDSARGRVLVVASLTMITALTVALSAVGGSGSAATRYGRPAIVILGCILVWQRRLWARWLLVLLGLGILLAGPIWWANGVPPWTLGGALSWGASLLYAVSLVILFRSRDALGYLAPAPASPSAPTSKPAGA